MERAFDVLWYGPRRRPLATPGHLTYSGLMDALQRLWERYGPASSLTLEITPATREKMQTEWFSVTRGIPVGSGTRLETAFGPVRVVLSDR